VTLAQMKEHGFPTKVNKLHLMKLLSEKYPDYKWEELFMFRGRQAQQKRMERAVTYFFQGIESIVNARKEAGILIPETKELLELDLYLPSLKLAFEYQVSVYIFTLFFSLTQQQYKGQTSLCELSPCTKTFGILPISR